MKKVWLFAILFSSFVIIHAEHREYRFQGKIYVGELPTTSEFNQLIEVAKNVVKFEKKHNTSKACLTQVSELVKNIKLWRDEPFVQLIQLSESFFNPDDYLLYKSLPALAEAAKIGDLSTIQYILGVEVWRSHPAYKNASNLVKIWSDAEAIAFYQKLPPSTPETLTNNVVETSIPETQTTITETPTPLTQTTFTETPTPPITPVNGPDLGAPMLPPESVDTW